MRILILEDELPAYEKLRTFIEKNIESHNILGWARSITEAKKLISDHPAPDLIFSDIELLDGSSFEVFEAHKVECPIIFSTAFDQYLFQAFQTNGIAYLLKPYSEESFQEALRKYHTLFESNKPKSIDQNVISELRNIIEGDKKTFKRRFSIKKKIINIDFVENIEPHFKNRLAIRMAKRKELMHTSSSKTPSFRTWLDS